MIFRLVIFFLLISGFSYAQLIRFDAENIASDDHIFNPGFIKEQQIKNATVEFSRKEEGERIENLLKRWIYFFDEEGRVSKIIKIDHPRVVNPDSSVTYCYYNPVGKVKIRRTFHHLVNKGEYYDYDDSGRLVKLVITNENNAGTSPSDFKPAQQQVQFLETYSYDKLTNEQEKVKVMNDQGTVYKEGMFYSSGSYPVEKEMRFVITGIRNNEKFSYDDQHRISGYTYYTDAAGDLEEKKSVIYDDQTGNLKTIDHFKNGEHTNQVFYFYDKKNLLLEGEVNKEIKTGTLLLRNYKFNLLEEVPNPSRR